MRLDRLLSEFRVSVGLRGGMRSNEGLLVNDTILEVPKFFIYSVSNVPACC